MTCERARELILDALVEPLEAELAAELREHLNGCEACAEEDAGYSALWEQLGSAAVPPTPRDALQRLEARVREEFGDAPRSKRTWMPLLRRAASVVLLVGVGAALAVGFDALRRPTGPSLVQGERYLLILTDTNEPQEQTEQFSSEMRAWVRSLGEQGIMESFELVDPSTPRATPPGGPLMTDDIFALMIIRGSSDAEARSIALQSPTLQYGGLVEIRTIN